MSRHKRYSVETVNVPRQFWEGWLTKLQKKAFGWEFSEGYSETEHGIDSNWNHTETTTHYYVFKRFSPYTGNILFNLAEMISNLICFLRRIVGLLFIPAVVVLFILAFSAWIRRRSARSARMSSWRLSWQSFSVFWRRSSEV